MKFKWTPFKKRSTILKKIKTKNMNNSYKTILDEIRRPL
jgi:hypothetical protein